MTKYFYFPPHKPQYYFPANKFINVFCVFYHPYSLKAKVVWHLWKKCHLFKKLFSINENSIPLPVKKIRRFLNDENLILCFNKGTLGKEQKSSIIAYNLKNKKKTFLKCSTKKKAKELSRNEIVVLKQIGEEKNFLPSLKKFYIKDDIVIFSTSFVDGKKYKETQMNEKLLELLIQFSNIEIKNIKEYGEKNIKKVFSHGDFCPWNLLVKDENIMAIDWEMAGNYPLGYDLFTFIFQTSFLLSPKKTLQEIFQQNSNYINNYFSNYSIKNWMEYLKSFAQIKTNIENQKDHSTLIKRYKELIKTCDEN